MERYFEHAQPEDRHPEGMPQRMENQAPTQPSPVTNSSYAPRYQEPPRSKSWYNQGWVWLIVAAIALVVIWLAFSGLTQQTAKINDSLQQQNGLMQQQNHLLASIRNSMNGLTQAVHDGFDRLITAIRDAADKLGG